jgi:hypothetical protein
MSRTNPTSVSGAIADMRSAGSARAAAGLWLAAQRAAVTSAALHVAGAPAASGSGIAEVLGLGCGLFAGSSSGLSSSGEASARPRQVGELLSAGNLDGRGGRDVLDFRIGTDGRNIRTAVTARDGRTGKALWSRVGSTGDLLVPFAERVGAARRPGVLLVSESGSMSGHTDTVTLKVEALSGPGTMLWSRVLTGEITSSSSGLRLTDLPAVGGLIHDVAGPGDDLLVGETSGKEGPSSGHGRVQPEVLSSSDGSLDDRGAPLTSTTSFPDIQTLPAVNGRGIDGIVAVVPGKPGHLVTERGGTGASIWTSGALPSSLFDDVTVVGPVSGGRFQDVAVSGLRLSAKGPADRVSLIRGSDGRVLWSHPSDCVMPLLKAGPNQVGAVGLITVQASGTRRSTTAQMIATARAAGDRLIYRKTVVVSVHRAAVAHSTSDGIAVSEIGDVQPDGSADIGMRLSATIGKKTVTRRSVISGRTGALISEPAEFPTDGSLHRGHGTDLVKPHVTPRGLQLAGYDGATGRQILTTRLRRTRGLGDPLVIGLRVTGHHCSDLGITATSTHKVLIGLFTATGKPRWTITARTTQLSGGYRRQHAVTGSSCL